MDLTYTSELFLTPKVIMACDSVISFLREGLGSRFGDPKIDVALEGVPAALWNVKSSMRADLLGRPISPDEPLITHEEDPRGPILGECPRRFR
jgi:hypothetical protein